MTPNQVVKSAYHLFAAFLLLFLLSSVKSIHVFLKGALAFLAFFHLYDAWWFFNYDGNAPI
jgi:hypothetical protein